MTKGESSSGNLEEELTVLRHHIDCIDRGQFVDDLGHDIIKPKEEIEDKIRSLMRAADREAYGDPDKSQKKTPRRSLGGR